MTHAEEYEKLRGVGRTGPIRVVPSATTIRAPALSMI